MSQEIHNNR